MFNNPVYQRISGAMPQHSIKSVHKLAKQSIALHPSLLKWIISHHIPLHSTPIRRNPCTGRQKKKPSVSRTVHGEPPILDSSLKSSYVQCMKHILENGLLWHFACPHFAYLWAIYSLKKGATRTFFEGVLPPRTKKPPLPFISMYLCFMFVFMFTLMWTTQKAGRKHSHKFQEKTTKF